MAVVAEDFLDAWRSGQHVGNRTPHQVVQVRRGNFRRAYRDWDGAISAWIPGESRRKPWYPIFTELTEWVTVPNVNQVDLAQASGDQNGCQVATVSLDNVWYDARTGPGGDYHAIVPGYLAPYRGEDPETRPVSGLEANEWSRVLTKNANIRIWQGFGPPVLDGDAMPEDGGPNGTWVFNGLVDDVDSESNPATASITARMGKTLTDEHCFGWVISKQLRDPVVFQDRLRDDKIEEVGRNAAASSRAQLDPPAYVLDDNDATAWLPANATSDSNYEWVEIRVPEGRYATITLKCQAGADIYIAVFPKPLSDGSAKRDGTAISGSGWDNPDFNPLLPNAAHGDFAYTIAHVAFSGDGTPSLGAEYEMGDGSIIRVAIRYSASELDNAVYKLRGRRRKRQTMKKILVDDLSDMVRVALRWGGFTEWDVEDTGVRLKDALVFNRSNFLIDIINKAAEATGFTFFISDPIDGSSFGIPTFRRSSALLREAPAPAPPPPDTIGAEYGAARVALEVHDDDLLTGLRVRESEEPLAYIIRVRGKEVAEKNGGLTLGGDKTKRLMIVYRPPWTRDNSMAGIIKHAIHTEPMLTTADDCRMGCFLIAIAEALEAVTGTATMPGNPYLELDDQMGVLDENTGTNQRMLVTNRNSTFKDGEIVEWVTTIAGAMIDNYYLAAVIADVLQTDFGDTPSPVLFREPRPLRLR